MAELNNKINILVSVDKTEGDRTLRSLTPSIGQHGRAAGDAWGKGFSTAAERWMRAIGGVLRRFGGEFGRNIAEGLEVSERFGKAIHATERAAITGVGQAGGTFAGQAGATALGAGVGPRLIDRFMRRVGTATAHFTPEGAVLSDIKYTTYFLGISKAALGVAGAIAAFGLALIGAINHMGKAREESRKLAKELGLVVGVFSALKDDKEFIDLWKKFGENGLEAAKKISKIKDPILKTQAIIKEFGNDGLNVYQSLIEASGKYENAQKKVNYVSEAFRDALMFTKQGLLDGVKWLTQWIFKVDQIKAAVDKLKLGLLNLIGITPKLAKDIQEGEANILKMTERLQEHRLKQIEEFNKKLDLQQEINQEILKMLEQQIPLETQVVEKRKLLNQLGKEALLDKAKELQYYKLANDLQKDEQELEKQRAENADKVQQKLNVLPFGLGGGGATDISKLTLSQRAAIDPELKKKYLEDYFKQQNELNKQPYVERTPAYLQDEMGKVGQRAANDIQGLLGDMFSGKISPMDAMKKFPDIVDSAKVNPMTEYLLRYEEYRKLHPMSEKDRILDQINSGKMNPMQGYTELYEWYRKQQQIPVIPTPPVPVKPLTPQEIALNNYKKQLELSLKPKDAIENLQIDTLQLLNTMIKNNSNRIPIVPVMSK